MAVKIGDVYRSLTGRSGETVKAVKASKEAGFVKLEVTQGGKILKTQKSAHVSDLMARTAVSPGFRVSRGAGESVPNI